ncbi:receptor protein kinase-like protein ZAR1 [Cynara cardunculus var. scolymus]|uniref:Leucine-rich repeat-containing protein n=1 Tax=Cynara cardunculus var. scolymus TaxID=59895 RepID=A0A103YN23_CYNCS|nr:receptor protein kinase-like protein ZAR1 [Cynara cardunculus var. scolymus]KVI12055.1 Leucine-rich repeat-containing protein [Cynara cardunculus var. scolymus]
MDFAQFLLFFCSFTTFISLSSSLNSDGISLLALKAAVSADPTNSLANWIELESTPCHWAGISCNSDQLVTSIFLPNKSLTGYIPSELGAILSLRHLSLSGNNFSKPIPDHLFNAAGLLSVDLSHNSLTGPIPENVNTLASLTLLDLSFNLLNGSLPESLGNLTHFSGTLNLSHNRFTGEIPASYGQFQAIVSLDLGYNNLTGKIPEVRCLLNQGPNAFTGNPFLCGFPLQTQCTYPEAQNPRVLPNPDSKDPGSLTGLSSKQKGDSKRVTVPLISGVLVVISVISVSVWVYRKKWRFSDGKIREKENLEKGQVRVSLGTREEVQDGKFVVMDEGLGLELEDLLRASAYVVGKSSNGIVYKVVAGRGSGTAEGAVLAVRRLSEGEGKWKLKEFEREVETIGKVQHSNIVRLRAYYYTNDEKLLVSDFISNGSLYSALHDKDGIANPLVPLSWAARLKIAQGIARGLAHIHECSPRKYVHGGLRSSKILLNGDLEPFISGFGINRLMPVTRSKSHSRKHHVAQNAKFSGQKCDVYSFGIVLLEILTGRTPDSGDGNDGKDLECVVRKAFQERMMLSEIIDPSLLKEVQAKKLVVATFHIALSCTQLDPDARPKMRMVSDSLHRIKLP